MAGRSFLWGFAVALIGAATLVVGAFYLSAGRINPLAMAGIGWTATILQERMAMLDAERGPSIVIVGGSSGLFGTTASMIETATGIHTINASSHGGLPWIVLDRTMLSRLRSGDTAILQLEYGYLANANDFPLNNHAVGAMHSLGLEFFFALDLSGKIHYLRLLPLPFVFRQLAAMAVGTPDRPNVGYWSAQSLPNGDVGPIDMKPDLEAVLATASRLRLPDSIAEPHRVCASIHALVARGVRVIGTPPALYVVPEKVAPYNALQPKVREFYEGCGAIYVSDPDSARQDLSAMLDTLYHLTDDGRKARTERLVQALCEKIPCPGVD